MSIFSSSALDALATAILVLDPALRVVYVNPAAENLFKLSSRNVTGEPLERVFAEHAALAAGIEYAVAHNCSYTQYDLSLTPSSLERLKPYQDAVAQHEKNVASIRHEISNLR